MCGCATASLLVRKADRRSRRDGRSRCGWHSSRDHTSRRASPQPCSHLPAVPSADASPVSCPNCRADFAALRFAPFVQRKSTGFSTACRSRHGLRWSLLVRRRGGGMSAQIRASDEQNALTGYWGSRQGSKRLSGLRLGKGAERTLIAKPAVDWSDTAISRRKGYYDGRSSDNAMHVEQKSGELCKVGAE